MLSRHKLILSLVIVLGLIALSAGIAVATAGGGGANPDLVSEEPGDDETGAAEAKDDEGSGDDDGSEGKDESDGTLTGDTAAKASDAALAAIGGGTVLSVESEDGNAGYEVEIRKADGSETDVELDKDFKLVNGTEDD